MDGENSLFVIFKLFLPSVTNPPGGRTSDIFANDDNSSTPNPRKIKDHMKSRIFNADTTDPNFNIKVSRTVIVFLLSLYLGLEF